MVKRLVERITAHRPVVLLLDDLHWADEDSLALLAYLLRAPSTPGLFVMATAWPPGDSDGEALDRFLRKMRRPGGDEVLTQLWLGPLGAEDGARVVEGALRQSAEFAPGAIEQICKEAAGNPFLLVELARLHAEHPELDIPTVSRSCAAACRSSTSTRWRWSSWRRSRPGPWTPSCCAPRSWKIRARCRSKAPACAGCAGSRSCASRAARHVAGAPAKRSRK